MAEIVRLCIPFISVVNSLNFAFVFACWQTNTVTINAEPTKKKQRRVSLWVLRQSLFYSQYECEIQESKRGNKAPILP